VRALSERQFAVALGLALLAASWPTAAVSPADPRVLEGFKSCPEHFYGGAAPLPLIGELNPGQLRALCFDGFAVLHSGASKTAVYVAEHISPASLKQAKGVPRTNRFYEEARLPAAHRARLSDYRGSAMDRGHLAAAAQRHTPESMAQSFSLANMVPQAPKNNQGAWRARVEAPTLKFAERSRQGVYVLTGPIHASPVRTIGAGEVWVPAALFKLVYDPAARRAWAYVVQNADEAKVGPPITYEDLVARLGMHLLPAGALGAQ